MHQALHQGAAWTYFEREFEDSIATCMRLRWTVRHLLTFRRQKSNAHPHRWDFCASVLFDRPGAKSLTVTRALLLQWLKCSFEAFSMRMMTKVWRAACMWPDGLPSGGTACCFVSCKSRCFWFQLIAGDAVGRTVCRAALNACFMLGSNRENTRDVLHVCLVSRGATPVWAAGIRCRLKRSKRWSPVHSV